MVSTSYVSLEAEVSALREELLALRDERLAALRILAPAQPEAGLVDACRQVQQALVVERAAAERLERLLHVAFVAAHRTPQ